MVSSETLICANCEGSLLYPSGTFRCKLDMHLCDKPKNFTIVNPYADRPQLKRPPRRKTKN